MEKSKRLSSRKKPSRSVSRSAVRPVRGMAIDSDSEVEEGGFRKTGRSNIHSCYSPKDLFKCKHGWGEGMKDVVRRIGLGGLLCCFMVIQIRLY